MKIYKFRIIHSYTKHTPLEIQTEFPKKRFEPGPPHHQSPINIGLVYGVRNPEPNLAVKAGANPGGIPKKTKPKNISYQISGFCQKKI